MPDFDFLTFGFENTIFFVHYFDNETIPPVPVKASFKFFLLLNLGYKVGELHLILALSFLFFVVLSLESQNLLNLLFMQVPYRLELFGQLANI